MPFHLTESFRINRARRRTASAATEYAVCLGLILATVLAAGYLLGTPLRTAFSGSAAGLGGPAAGEPSGIAASAPSNSAQPVADAASPLRRGPILWLTLLAATAVPFVAAWWLGHRRGARAAAAEPKPAEFVPRELQAKFVAKRQSILSYLSGHARQLVNGRMTAKDIMSRPLWTQSPDDDVSELRELMTDNVIRHLLICSPDGTLEGIISDRDLSIRSGLRARDIMTPHPISVGPDTPVATVITILLTQRISCVPVVEADQRLCGIVTTSDVLIALQCLMRLIEQLALPIDWPAEEGHAMADAKEPEVAGIS